MQKLVLFDIDGTLLASRGAGRRALVTAMLREYGVKGPYDGVRFDGKTDPQIVRELLTISEHPDTDSEETIAAICARYLELLAAELAGGPAPHVYPGVHRLLELLSQRDDALVGLLTGNLAHGARLKLDAAGLPFDQFRVGAFGSDHHERAQLPAIAAERAEPLMGRIPAGQEVVIIGDTPADMTCGREIGARAIGVATGSFSTSDLMDAGGYTALATLEDPEAVLTAIFA